MIVAWYLRLKFSKFGSECVIHIGGAWHWDSGMSSTFIWFNDAGYNY